MEVQNELPLDRAIRLAGGPTELMRRLRERGHEIKGSATVHQWRLNGTPADYCPDIEYLTGVACEELRPKTNWALLRKAASQASANADVGHANQ